MVESEKFQNHESVYRIISEQARDCIFCKDTDLKYTYANPAMLRLLDCEEEELLGKTSVEVFGRQNAEVIQSVDAPVLEGNTVDEVRDLIINDKTLSFHTVQVPMQDAQGRVTGICGIVRDVTQRKQLQDTLQLQRDLSLTFSRTVGLDNVLHCLLDHLLKIECIDAGGVYLRDRVTGAFDLAVHRGLSDDFVRAVSHYDADQPQAEIIIKGEAILTHYSRLNIPFDDIRMNEEIKAIAVFPLAHENAVIGCLNVASHTRDAFPEHSRNAIQVISGMIGGAIVRAQTHDALLESEELLRQSEKMRAIGQLAGGIAHDFNNQLTGIVGAADMLRDDLPNGSELAHLADDILVSAKRASELTAQLLAFARKGKYLSVPIDLHRIIHEVTGILEHTIDKKIQIHQHLDAQLPMVKGDPTQIQNAIMNIALNARDAMPNGGELTVSTSIENLGSDFCNRSVFDISPGNYVRLSIADSGVGMDEHTRSQMFEPFFTTKEKRGGTGMGLASAYGTLRNHGGAVDVKSMPGQGTVVKVYLPQLLEEMEDSQPEAFDSAEEVSGACVLLVDDEEFVIDTARRMLAVSGFTVHVCRNGAQALRWYTNHWQEVDLVLLDMVMPEMGGRETYMEMKKINPDVRVLLSSGYSVDGDAREIIDAGCDGFIQKPYRRTELTGKISEILRAV